MARTADFSASPRTRRIASLLLAFALSFSLLPLAGAHADEGSNANLSVVSVDSTTDSGAATTSDTSTEGSAAIVFTNDVHCGIEDGLGYAGVVAYVKEAEARYGEENVTLVDAGDAIQGAAVGTLSEGSSIIDIMNEAGYDYAVPGNHEFDYGMDRFFELVEMADFTYLSCNFTDLRTGTTPLAAYDIRNYENLSDADGGTLEIAFVGITTPETLTKSSPASFQDENGNYIYGFCEDSTGQTLYDAVQASVNAAIAEGADYVVAVGHLGRTGIDARWTSDAVISHTTGIDAFIDGHSHERYITEVQNLDGEAVPLAQTGTKLATVGELVIDPDADDGQNLSFTLTDAESYAARDADMQTFIDKVNAEFAELLEQVVGYTDYDLVAYSEELWLYTRFSETNLGDLVADAYRSVLGADIGIVNGGGVRENIAAGPITYNDLISVHPYGNELCLVEVSGQTILDALEMGVSKYPDPSGGFFQVSGLEYSIRTDIESSVVVDEYGNFVSVDGERRVCQVFVGGDPIDPEARYTLASHDYTLLEGGDGMTMFLDDDVEVLLERVMLDNQSLIEYVSSLPDATVGSEYADLAGAGRITFVTAEDLEEEQPASGPGEADDEAAFMAINGSTGDLAATGDETTRAVLTAAFVALAAAAAATAAAQQHASLRSERAEKR